MLLDATNCFELSRADGEGEAGCEEDRILAVSLAVICRFARSPVE